MSVRRDCVVKGSAAADALWTTHAPGGMSCRLAIEGDGYRVSLMGGADNGEYLPIGAQCNRPDNLPQPELCATGLCEPASIRGSSATSVRSGAPRGTFVRLALRAGAAIVWSKRLI